MPISYTWPIPHQVYAEMKWERLFHLLHRVVDPKLSPTSSVLLLCEYLETGKDTLFDVYEAVYDCRAKWRNLCLALRVSSSNLSTIDEKRRGDPDTCLQDGLSLWLQGHYNTDTHGPPTWRMLVEAVYRKSGGDDHELAKQIASNHPAGIIWTHIMHVHVPASDNDCNLIRL